MRVVFMGTPEFSVPCLARLLEDGHDVAGVFTQPDKPKGRGKQLAASPVKAFALEHDIPVFQPRSMRDGEAVRILTELQPELIVVTAFGKILPAEVLDFPKYGSINIHASLLPRYRGAAPIQWAVLNGETVTGVTSMQMDVGLDTGDMLLRRETPIGEQETAGELWTGHAPNSIRVYAPGEALHNRIRPVRILALYEDGVAGIIEPTQEGKDEPL